MGETSASVINSVKDWVFDHSHFSLSSIGIVGAASGFLCAGIKAKTASLELSSLRGLEQKEFEELKGY